MEARTRHAAVTRCHSIALYRLRKQHLEEFYDLLGQVYQEEGLDVPIRGPRKQPKESK